MCVDGYRGDFYPRGFSCLDSAGEDADMDRAADPHPGRRKRRVLQEHPPILPILSATLFEKPPFLRALRGTT